MNAHTTVGDSRFIGFCNLATGERGKSRTPPPHIEAQRGQTAHKGNKY